MREAARFVAAAPGGNPGEWGRMMPSRGANGQGPRANDGDVIATLFPYSGAKLGSLDCPPALSRPSRPF